MFMFMYKIQEICMDVTEQLILAIGHKQAHIWIYILYYIYIYIYIYSYIYMQIYDNWGAGGFRTKNAAHVWNTWHVIKLYYLINIYFITKYKIYNCHNLPFHFNHVEKNVNASFMATNYCWFLWPADRGAVPGRSLIWVVLGCIDKQHILPSRLVSAQDFSVSLLPFYWSHHFTSSSVWLILSGPHWAVNRLSGGWFPELNGFAFYTAPLSRPCSNRTH